MDTHLSSKPARAARSFLLLALAVLLALFACGCRAQQQPDAATGSAVASISASESTSASAPEQATPSEAPSQGLQVEESGSYISKDEVALYIHEFGHLPGNFISKTKARKAGWVASEGNLDEVCPGKSIGGSVFYNDDGALPDARGRTWTECDIGYTGGFRGAERIVFSNDGLVYYTGDHYNTFERLY